MKKNAFYALLLGVALLLAGCAHDSEIIVKIVPKFPPDNLLQDCPVETPPAREAYKTAGDGVSREEAAAKREKMLADFGGKQTQNIATCNTDKKGLREWKLKQQAIYEKEQKGAEAKSKNKD